MSGQAQRDWDGATPRADIGDGDDDRDGADDGVAEILGELPADVRDEIDREIFARLTGSERRSVTRLAGTIGSHVVAYDLRRAESGRPLCATVRHAQLGSEQLSALEAVQDTLPQWVALVAYVRPAQLRPAARA